MSEDARVTHNAEQAVAGARTMGAAIAAFYEEVARTVPELHAIVMARAYCERLLRPAEPPQSGS